MGDIVLVFGAFSLGFGICLLIKDSALSNKDIKASLDATNYNLGEINNTLKSLKGMRVRVKVIKTKPKKKITAKDERAKTYQAIAEQMSYF